MRLDATDPRVDVLEAVSCRGDATPKRTHRFYRTRYAGDCADFSSQLIVIESVLHLARNQATMTPVMMMTTPSDAGLIVGTK